MVGRLLLRGSRYADAEARLQKLADTLATTISAGLLNGFPVSAFAQNVGLVAITGIKSRFVVAVSGIILVALGLVALGLESQRLWLRRPTAAGIEGEANGGGR